MKLTEVRSSCNPKITIYRDFPEPSKTGYSYPRHVSEDAIWARFHLQGKEVVAGHLVNNVFSIVFLDKNHEFYISEMKNT